MRSRSLPRTLPRTRNFTALLEARTLSPAVVKRNNRKKVHSQERS